MVKKAVIIAAGNGSRLARRDKDIPKPLRKVAGLSLIKRIILLAKKGGISEFVVVVGYQKDRIIRKLMSEDLGGRPGLGVKLQFVENPEWKKSNGLSVLAAKDHLRENFILLMSDHIFDVATLEKLRQTPLGVNRALLAVDHKLGSIFDMDDATKVKTEKGKVIAIDKTLTDFDAVDTGMFLAGPALFEALEEVKKGGNCSLSDGIRLLADRGQMGVFDVQGGWWQDVDTEASLKQAEKVLFNACRKSTDGFISRHFNRHISLFLSRLLIRTNLSANHVTGLTALVGILAGVFVARGDYWNVLLGAFLFKLSSILDGCDGEISKLKLSSSKLGQWLDTISDNLTYVCFIIGAVVGVGRQGNPHIALTGTLTIFGVGMTMLVAFVYVIRNSNSGSLLVIQRDFNKFEGGPIKKLFSRVQFMIKRDFFALLFFVIAVFGKLEWILWASLVGSNVAWMVFLNSYLGLFKPAVVVKESPGSASR
ncbi:MAG: NTP transferase domain-containing protein [Deltaproteobacteria bacterium]|nr:NTP transferase domain-containing protein [Deltaproteobacteria bacterium]